MIFGSKPSACLIAQARILLKTNSFKRALPFITTPFFAAAGRLGGLLIPFFVAFYFGATKLTDAFFLVFGMVTFLLGIFQYLFESLILPYLAEEKRDDPARIIPFAARILTAVIPVLMVVSLLIGLFLLPFLRLSFVLEDGSAALVQRLFLEMIPFLILGVLTAAANGIFHIYKVFWLPAVSTIIRTAGVLVCLFVGARLFGIHAVTIGFSAGELLRWGISFWLLVRLGYWRTSGQTRRRNEPLRHFSRQVFYQLGAMVAASLVPLVSFWFALGLGEGKLSLFAYAERLYSVPYQLFLAGILHIFVSDWSDIYCSAPSSEFWSQTRQDVRKSFWISAVVSAGLFFLREPLVGTLYGFSGIGGDSVRAIAEIFGWFVVGFPAMVVSMLYGRILFVARRSAFFFVIAVGRLFLVAAVTLLLTKSYGVSGIAMASTAAFFASVFLLRSEVRKVQYLETRGGHA